MARKINIGSTKRFGPRYGRRNREKLAIIEREHRIKRKCPFCSYVKVKRLSIGIWQCEKCNAKFSGKAYTFESDQRRTAAAPTEEIKDSESDEDAEAEEEKNEEAEVA